VNAEPRLTGVRVLVTRPRERSEELCFLLEDEGAEVVPFPLLELVPPLDPRPLRAAADQLQRYRWILFASPSAVHGLMDAAREAGTLGRLSHVKLGVVGPATLSALEGYGLSASANAEVSTGTGLFDAISSDLQAGDEVLLPAAREGRRELETALVDAGAQVTRVIAYESVVPDISQEVLDALRNAPPDVTLFGSPRTFEAFLSQAKDVAQQVLNSTRVVVMGPTTASALIAQGVPVAAVAASPSAEGLVEATVQAVRGAGVDAH
jgi:uroporphyrinogen-III synthase